MFRSVAVVGLSVFLTLGSAAMAENVSFPMPAGEVILKVSGNIGTTNEADEVWFDQAMLEQLPQTAFTTATVWTDGPHTYAGVSLKDLLEAVGAKGSSIQAVALNDYAVSIPLSDALDGGAIVAYHTDGSAMSVRDKGPLWILYPFDDKAKYRTEVHYSRSIWQLARIGIVE